MIVYTFDKGKSKFAILCDELLTGMGFDTSGGAGSHLAIAPLLERKVSDADIAALGLGVLIFHPSLLPELKGKRAIRDAYKSGRFYTGVTWFWANSTFDGGDIFIQSPVKMDYSKTPSEFYNEDIIPAGLALLEMVASDILAGKATRRKQL